MIYGHQVRALVTDNKILGEWSQYINFNTTRGNRL